MSKQIKHTMTNIWDDSQYGIPILFITGNPGYAVDQYGIQTLTTSHFLFGNKDIFKVHPNCRYMHLSI